MRYMLQSHSGDAMGTFENLPAGAQNAIRPVVEP
jgi:hypothetical protein